MNLKKAILHIYDINNDNFLFSQAEISRESLASQNYIEKINDKLLLGDCKNGILDDDSWLKALENVEETFVDTTITLAEKMFGIMKDNAAIPKGDLLFYLYDDDESLETYLGIIKLNFAEKYTHNVEYAEDAMVNQLIVNHNILPASNQKVEEGVLINVGSKEYSLIEKAYILEQEGRCCYFSEKFLHATAKKNIAQNIKEMKKVVEKVSDRYGENTYEKKASAQEAVRESIQQFGKIDNEYVAGQVFKENISAKEEYVETIKSKDVEPEILVRNSSKYEKKYSKQKFKLDNGIELSIPADVYKNRDVIEFINNPDGTISVVIKNIDGMESKFS